MYDSHDYEPHAGSGRSRQTSAGTCSTMSIISVEMMHLGSCSHLTFMLWLGPVAFHKLVNNFQLPTCCVLTHLILLYLLVNMLCPLSLSLGFWHGYWQMHRQTSAVLACMHSGFPAGISEQMIMTLFHDVTRISHAIEGGNYKRRALPNLGAVIWVFWY